MLNTFTKDDFMIYISGPRDIYSFTFDILDINYYEGTGIAFTTLSIEIDYSNSG
jgi:hypothetical protein